MQFIVNATEKAKEQVKDIGENMSEKIISIQDKVEEMLEMKESKVETADMVMVRDNNNNVVGIVKQNCNIAGEMYPEELIEEDGYATVGITRLADGRYVLISFLIVTYDIVASIITEEQALLEIIKHGKEKLLNEKKFQDLKKVYDGLSMEMAD